MRSSVIWLALAIVGCGEHRKVEPQPGQNPAHGAAPTTNAAAQAGASMDDGEWTMAAKNYASTRFSGLNEINPGNAAHLAVAATFSTGVFRGHEEAPLVVGTTMYLVTPYPNVFYAIDLTQPGNPVKWVFKPAVERASQGVACCDVVNRGAAYDNGRLFFNTLDGHTIALDANTGKELWNTKLADINLGETITMAPLVVKGKVLVGNSGGEMGVRGWLVALDEGSGKVAWKAWSTGPDKDVLIGPRFHPFYQNAKGTDLGVKTWQGDQWKTGGGSVWGWISYDPALNLIFYGTANPGPWNPNQRPGENKWSTTLFARDPDTGEAVWGYQYNPHDLHDYDGVNENVLIDLPLNGATRKVLLHPDRNGYMYVIDRTNGEVLSAKPFAHTNAVDSINMKTGLPAMNSQKAPEIGVTTKDICPAAPGGKDWQPSAFSPRTGILYVPRNNLCMDEEPFDVSYTAGTPYVGMNVKMKAGPGGNGGFFTAWNPATGKAVWEIAERWPVWSGALVTAGDVVFYGTMDGWFKAVDARDGHLLWRYQTGSGIIGQPITYKGPDGKQYVAVMSGVGGWAGARVVADLDSRDSTGALGFVGATRDLDKYTTKGGTLYVFALK